jgi:hypothetical protein
MALFSSRLTAGIFILLTSAVAVGQTQAPPASSSSSKHSKNSLPHPTTELDSGSIVSGVYHNRSLELSYKVPAGWVLRTDEMNAPEEGATVPPNEGRVLLAAFSRPPEARGEEVNSSIVIAAERQSAYPGLEEAAQYFGPLTEVAKAQGFTVDEEPYEFEIGRKKLVRSDFHKDVGSRVMRQSTLALLAHGYAVSITIIAGSEDDLEQLVDALNFATVTK